MEQKKENKIILFLKDNFSKKNNISRLIIFGIIALVFLPIAIGMNLWAQFATYDSYGSGFVHIHITTNPGVAFSFMANSPTWSVYFTQWFISIVILFVILFSKKKYYIALWSCAFLGGVFNVIDRACIKNVACMIANPQINCVVDYFEFNFSWGIFNVPDIFVCVGVIGSAIIYLTETIVSIKKENGKRQK